MQGQARLDEAIAGFPVLSWLSAFTVVKDGGGANYYADCPVCTGHDKLRIRKGTHFWKCYRCTDGGHGDGYWKGRGSLVSLVSHLEGIPTGKAIRFIAEKAGIPDLAYVFPEAPHSKIPREALKLADFDQDHMAWQRLRERGLTHLAPRIYGCVTGDYADRWILPARYLGTLEGIEAKAWYPSSKPKALYPTWFRTPDSIYTTYDFDLTLGFAVITESIFDAETFQQNGIGLFGSQLLPGQFTKLLDLRSKGITTLFWALDPDAHKKQAQAILQNTLGLFKNYMVVLPSNPNGMGKMDPNAAGQETCWDSLDTAVPIESELDLLGGYL
jgi:hypothetical protein